MLMAVGHKIRWCAGGDWPRHDFWPWYNGGRESLGVQRLEVRRRSLPRKPTVPEFWQ